MIGRGRSCEIALFSWLARETVNRFSRAPVKQLTAISLRLRGNNYKLQVMNYRYLTTGTKFSAVCSFFLSTDNCKLLTVFHVSWILYLGSFIKLYLVLWAVD